MKSIKQSSKKAAFTIVELLVVMSIIMILMGILLPAFNRAKRYARKVKQTAQFKSIDVGLELYRGEFEGYPESDAEDDTTGTSYNYPGAMKLAEAMLGKDLLGFHPSSVFSKDGKNAALTAPYDDLYPCNPPTPYTAEQYQENLRSREGPYLQLESANPYSLLDLYGAGNFGTLGDTGCDPNAGFVLCDEYKRIRTATTGRRVGSPILYYRADISRTIHDKTAPTQSIYNSRDNQEIINLGIAWDMTTTYVHPMASSGTDYLGNPADWTKFYEMTRDEKVDVIPRPKLVDSYILISAGYDGLYGTGDDIFNFKR